MSWDDSSSFDWNSQARPGSTPNQIEDAVTHAGTSSLALKDTYIAVGKTTWDNAATGFILGVDTSDSKAKFYIGDTTHYMNWDGATLTYTSGLIVEPTVRLYVGGVIKTAETVMAGAPTGVAGILINKDGFYAGTATQTVADANVRILANGSAYFSGTISASTIDIGGDDTTSFHVDSTGYLWMGAAAADKLTAPLRITAAGAITAIGGTFQSAATGARTVLDSSGLAIYDATTQRAKIGSDGSGWLGASNVFAWTSAGVTTIGGFTVSSTTIADSTNIVIDQANKMIYLKTSTFGNQGIQFDYNAGTPRFYVGDGSTNYAKFDGTKFEASGLIKGSYVYGSSLMTKGTYLRVSCTAGDDKTLEVGDTTDFPASGTASFIDSANDRDTFTYTSKTATQLVDCDGVLAHTVSASNKPLVVPAGVSSFYLSDTVDEFRFFGDIGGGTVEELVTIGSKNIGNHIVASFGSLTDSAPFIGNWGVKGLSYGAYGVYGESVLGTGIYGKSNSAPGVYGESNTSSGVYGKSTSGYSVYSFGTTYLGGNVTFVGTSITMSASESWIGPSSTTGVYFKSGYVGIGLITPSASLHVKQASNSWDGGIKITDQSGSNYSTLHQENSSGLWFGMDGVAKMVILSGGNVGIGRVPTDHKLEVEGNIVGNELWVASATASLPAVRLSKLGSWYFASATPSETEGPGAFNNIAFGANTLERITSGESNIGIGVAVMPFCTEGYYNLGIGTGSLTNLTTGNYNNALGYALFACTTGSGNVSIGDLSGYGLTEGDNNTFIGGGPIYGTGSSITTGDNNICIGPDAGPTTNVSNKLFIDTGQTDTPLIGGDFSARTLYFGGNVGFNTTAPDKVVEINSATGICLRLTYNDANGSAANYTDLAVSSTGDLIVTPSGADVFINGGVAIGHDSGGTAPGDNNLLVDGTLHVDGVATLDGGLVSNAISYINDTANANMTLGLTINQGANDDEIISLKSSDVAHGMTTITETDTYGSIKKYATEGGMLIRSMVSSTIKSSFVPYGVVETVDTTTSGVAEGPLLCVAAKKNGTGLAALGADDNVFVISNLGTAEFIVKGDGDIYYNGADQGAFDIHDDALACQDLSMNLSKQLGRVLKYNKKKLHDMGVIAWTPYEDGREDIFISRKGMDMLTLGAVGELYRVCNKLCEKMGLTFEEAKCLQ